MIATFVLILFANLWEFAFQLFPSGSLPEGVYTAITTAISWLWMTNIFLDINTLMTVLGLWIALELTIQLIEFFFWVYSKIPVFGKK